MVRCRMNGSYMTLSNDEFVRYALAGDIDGINPDEVFVTGATSPHEARGALWKLEDAVVKACPPGNGRTSDG